jgi:hypothetical protein
VTRDHASIDGSGAPEVPGSPRSIVAVLRSRRNRRRFLALAKLPPGEKVVFSARQIPSSQGGKK